MRERSLFKVSVMIAHTTEITRLYHYIVNTYTVNDAIDEVINSLKRDGFTFEQGYQWTDIHGMRLVHQTGIITSYNR